jgi:glycosyltransferase involved in cell wall biosynthesis
MPVSNSIPPKLKILIGAHTGLPVGGISKNYEALLASDLPRKANVTFIETSKGGLAFSERGGRKIANLINAGENIFRFIATVLKVKPDIVYLGTASGLSLLKHGGMALIARLLGFKVIVQFHFSYSKLNMRGLVGGFIQWVIPRCSGIVILSSEWFPLAAKYPKLPVKFIPNAIDTSLFSDIQRPRTADSTVRLLYLGHLGREKGTFELLQAIQQLDLAGDQSFELNLYGESITEGDYQTIDALIKDEKLSARVKIHHPVYDEEKKQVFAFADVFILPSHHEGMPMSIIEAMAAGLPVVATRVGGIIDQVVDGKTGFLVQPGDANHLSAVLAKLIGDKELRMRMGTAGREKAVNQYDIDIKVDAILSFCETVRSFNQRT